MCVNVCLTHLLYREEEKKRIRICTHALRKYFLCLFTEHISCVLYDVGGFICRSHVYIQNNSDSLKLLYCCVLKQRQPNDNRINMHVSLQFPAISTAQTARDWRRRENEKKRGHTTTASLSARNICLSLKMYIFTLLWLCTLQELGGFIHICVRATSRLVACVPSPDYLWCVSHSLRISGCRCRGTCLEIQFNLNMAVASISRVRAHTYCLYIGMHIHKHTQTRTVIV